MSILWKKIEFYKEERNREAIVIVAGGLGCGAASLLQQEGFSIMGAHSFRQYFSPPHESLSSPYCYLK